MQKLETEAKLAAGPFGSIWMLTQRMMKAKSACEFARASCVFTAFQFASALHNHDACEAGLVIALPPSPFTPPCDIHPTQLGREILAATVELAKWAGR